MLVFKFFQFIAWSVSRILGKLFLGLEYVGQDNVKFKEESGVVYISNHGGYFDPFLISSGIRLKYFLRSRAVRYMTFYKHIRHKWYGFFIWLCGAYSLFPKKYTLDVSLAPTIKKLKRKQDILIFPVGKLKSDLKVSDARPGIAYIAKTCDPLIIPVRVSGTYRISFREFITRKRKVKIIFGKPFRYRDVTSETEDLIKMAADIMGPVAELEV